MIILGIVLVIAGILLPQFAILVTIGILLLVVGPGAAGAGPPRSRGRRPFPLVVKEGG